MYQPIYKALASLRHKLPNIPGAVVRFPNGENVKLDGSYRNLNPGDPFPGAETWNNPYLWAKRNLIARIDGKPVLPGKQAEYVPPHPSTDEDVKRSLEPQTRREPPFPKAGPGDIGPGPEGSTPATVDPSDEEMDKAVEAKPIDPKLLDDLAARSRKELLALAQKAGLKINGDESKAEIAKSLLA